MRAIWITRHGGPEVLQVRDTPDPTPGPGQVRLKVHAAGLNFAEMMARQGLYPDAPKPPCVVGYEASGVIDALGEGVSGPPVGTKVIALSKFGAHTDSLVVPAGQVLPMPEGMTFEEGAALPVVYLTAYHMLFRVGWLRPGMKVLIHMAAGGVGLAALQLCRTVPGVVTFGTASASKHEVIKQHGCDHPIDYRSVDYAAEVRKLTNGQGVDLILDALGGEDWKKGYDLLGPAGLLIAFGFANMASGETRNLFHVVSNFFKVPKYSPMKLMDDNKGVTGVNVGHLWGHQELLVGELKALLELYQQKKIKPVIDSTYKYEQAAEAHKRISERKNVGKVVLVP
ncbi:MAG: zinc-binding dehydrogenase [Deltaproteobacteria bacterium]|nr:zinc-binding dehydrogenase [Deltaproteobacteria bacterium]